MSYHELLKRARATLPRLEEGRFETPRPVVALFGKQTAIRNFAEIARTLRREPAHIAKYFFKELAVPGSIAGGELLLQGRVSSDLITTKLHEYVKEFVLCKECKRPDTVLQRQDRLWFLRCEACGASRPTQAL